MNKRLLHNFRKLFVTSLALVAFSFVNAQTIEISANPSASANVVTGSGNYHVSECIYQEAEIGAGNFISAATAISRLEVYASPAYPAPSPTNFGSFSVYMKEVPSTTSTFAAGVYDKTGYTQVYTGSLDVTDTGWLGINLATPFTRTAGNNLSVMFERLDGVARTVSAIFVTSNGNSTSATATATRRYNSATAPVLGTTSLATSVYRTAIRLVHVNSNDAALSGIIPPTASCYTAPQNIGVVITNGGAAPIAAGAANVTLTLTGANPGVAVLPNTTVIAAGASETVTFTGVSLANPGPSLATAIVAYTGDANSTNDTAKTIVTNTPVNSVFPVVESAETIPPPYFSYLKLQSGNNAWSLWQGPPKYINPNLSSAGTDSLGAQSGNNFYYFNSFQIQNSDEILHSGCMSLPPSGGSSDIYSLSFYMSHDTSYSALPLGIYLDSIYVVVSTDKGLTWNRINGYQRNDPTALVPTWKQHTVDLNAFAGQTIQIGFEGVSQWGNIIGLDNIVFTVQTLPIKLLSFNGERNGSSNRLFWATATETNNKGFELQRSVDGINFSKLSFTESKAEGGNSSRTISYDFTDNKPFATTNYYRLKQVDKDGKFEYSNVILIKGKASSLSISSVYPNPAVNNLKVVMATPASEKVTLVVTDLAGKVVMQTATQLIAGDNSLNLDVKAIAKGTYTIKMICSNGCNSNVVRFVKQ